MSTNTKAISDDILKVAFSIAGAVEGTSQPSVRAVSAIAKAIHDAVMAERERGHWQPIETAPKDGTPIDLWGVNHLHPQKTGRRATDVTWGPVRDWMGRERADWQHGMAEDFEPTHWQPLPSAPKAEG